MASSLTRSTGGSPPDLVYTPIDLTSLDAAGAPYLGAYGNHLPTSPNIDKLARTAGGTVFERAYAHPAEHKRGPSSQETLWPRSCTKSDCRPPHSRRARTSPRSGGSPADLTCSTSTFPSGCLITTIDSIGQTTPARPKTPSHGWRHTDTVASSSTCTCLRRTHPTCRPHRSRGGSIRATLARSKESPTRCYASTTVRSTLPIVISNTCVWPMRRTWHTAIIWWAGCSTRFAAPGFSIAAS